MHRFVSIAVQLGKTLCSMAVIVSGISSMSCRFNWYQPEEPEGFEAFMNDRSNITLKAKQ